MLTSEDAKYLEQKKIAEKQVYTQLNNFKQGFPYLEIVSSATVEKGILAVDESEKAFYLQQWDNYLQGNHKIVKFVPASGAASRMFKDLFEFLDSKDEVSATTFLQTFFERIEEFAFYQELNAICLKNEGKDISGLIASKNHKAIIRNLLKAEGLNYGFLPKGLLKFHIYPDGNRTAMEEHLAESALYARNNNKQATIHYTVSPEHKTLFSQLTQEKLPEYESLFDTKFTVSFSEQKSSTDTIAANSENEPFRDKNGQLLFRPGGHGALIENLNDIDGDIIFIKNIDNVVPDQHKADTITYKKLIAGILISVQQKNFEYVQLIDSGKYTPEQIREIIYYVQNTLNVKNPDTKTLEDGELVLYLRSKLDRPLRVCGMVKNSGEPGGGPFFAVNPDNTISLQILESSQIDLKDSQKKAMFEQGTHFNPVDLVCAVKDYQGKKYNLPDYVDKNTGFISIKSKDGKELKAMELPGLWNGAMSDWNTLFVEVPASTFNPVKTVNDLLRKEHL